MHCFQDFVLDLDCTLSYTILKCVTHWNEFDYFELKTLNCFWYTLQRVWRQFFFIAPDFHCWHWLTERTEWKKVATPYLSGVHEAASANFFKWIIQQLEVTAIHTYPWPQTSNYWCILPLSPGLFCCRSGSFLCFIWGRKYYQVIVWKMVPKYDLGDSYIH